MRRTEWRQETRKMRFEEAYGKSTQGRLSQEEAAQIDWVSVHGRFCVIEDGTMIMV